MGSALQLSDYVLIGTTLLLAATALLAPYVAEWVKRWAFAPKLEINFRLSPPLCRLSSRYNPAQPTQRQLVYDFHFEVHNHGKSQARQIEAVLEALWVYGTADKKRMLDDFAPVNLRYDSSGTRFVDLNPGRRTAWNIGHISSLKVQKTKEKSLFIDVPEAKPDQLRFLLDQLEYPFFQPNCLLPGTYAIRVTLYSENASRVNAYFKIEWSGVWKDTEEEMFKEIVISRVRTIR